MCCQVALKPVYEELDQKVSYGLLESISVGLGDVISDLLQKTLDNVCINNNNVDDNNDEVSGHSS